MRSISIPVISYKVDIMEKIPYCVPEIIEAVLCTARNVSDELFIHKKVLNTVIDKISRLEELGDSPYELMRICLRAAYKALGVSDPYEKEKQKFNDEVSELEGYFNEFVTEFEDELEARIDIAAALNCKDLGTCLLDGMCIEKGIQRLLRSKPVAGEEIAEFKRVIRNARTIIYITASAGEIVADRELVRLLSYNHDITVAVAPHPMLLRALHEDAQRSGISEFAAVVDPGADMFGLNLEKASSEFRDVFKKSDVVLIKGGVNADTLSNCGRDYFILGAGHTLVKNENSEFCRESTIIRKYLKYIEP